MNKERNFSEEFLNSFVDNQLTSEEKGQAYQEISQDAALNREVCELRRLHDLVQLAYRDVPPPATIAARRTTRRVGAGIAAAMLLALGVGIGTQIDLVKAPRTNTGVATGVETTPPVASVATNAELKLAATAQGADAEDAPISHYALPATAVHQDAPDSRVLIHVTYNDSERVRVALQETEDLLRYYRSHRQAARVEIVFNGRGLDSLRHDTTQFASAIARLQKQYDNLTFAACQNTIDRVKREQGIVVKLLPGVIVIDSGMAEIMRRQDQGWAYLQV